MKRTVSLRYQINLRILSTSIILLVLGSAITLWQARLSVKTELASSLNLAAQLIQLNFPVGPGNKLDVNAWLPRFISLEQTRHLTIQLQQPSGVIANFAAQAKPAHKAMPPLWFVHLLSTQPPQLVQHYTNPDGEQVSLIIKANPIDEISEVWQESQAFFITLVVMAAITFLSVNVLFNKTIKAINTIVKALKAIERGDYQQKLPDFAIQEYDSIAKAVNHAADVLDVTHKENQALTLHTLQIQEEGQQHLAQELHDELGQSLTAIKVMATTIKNDEGKSASPIADTIVTVCDHLITVVRAMMRNLHPLVLTELGLKASLEDLLNHWSQRQPGLALTLNCLEDVNKLEQKITIQVFRIVQECLTNIVRHAQATEATIKLSITEDRTLCLEVCDNGQGCTLDANKNGFGLLGIRERINSLGGELSLQTAPQQGMVIKASIPIP